MPWIAREATSAWRWFVIVAAVEVVWLAVLAWLAVRG